MLKYIIPLLLNNGVCNKMQIMQDSERNFSHHAIDQLIKRLDQYRLEHRVTQQQIADEIGVVFSTVSRWFSGKTRPNKIQRYHIEKFMKGKK